MDVFKHSMNYGKERENTVPTRPTSEQIEAGKQKLDPRDVLRVIIQETPELRDAAISAGVVNTVETED